MMHFRGVYFFSLMIVLSVFVSFQHGVGHPGNKGSHVVFLGDMNMLFSTGFSRMNERQLAIWDVVRINLFFAFSFLANTKFCTGDVKNESTTTCTENES